MEEVETGGGADGGSGGVGGGGEWGGQDPKSFQLHILFALTQI